MITTKDAYELWDEAKDKLVAAKFDKELLDEVELSLLMEDDDYCSQYIDYENLECRAYHQRRIKIDEESIPDIVGIYLCREFARQQVYPGVRIILFPGERWNGINLLETMIHELVHHTDHVDHRIAKEPSYLCLRDTLGLDLKTFERQEIRELYAQLIPALLLNIKFKVYQHKKDYEVDLELLDQGKLDPPEKSMVVK